MVLSLLPARSAPKGVSSPFSFSASAALTPPQDEALASSASATVPSLKITLIRMLVSDDSEGGLDGQGDEVPIGQALLEGQVRVGAQCATRAAEEVGVVQSDAPRLLVRPLEADAEIASRAGAAVELLNHRRIAVQVVAQPDRHRDIELRHHLEPLRLEDEAQPIRVPR